MSLPESHPSVHEHNGASCPVTGQTYAFCPPQKGDIRSPCPALNTMANHGYIARDGKNISATEVMKGLKACYGLSTPLASFLAYVGFILLRKFARRLSLADIGKHNVIEHDASLVHHDTPEGQEFAPIDIDQELVEAFIKDIRPNPGEVEGQTEEDKQILMDAEDVARSRIRREKECRPINSVRAKIARGEMAIALGFWEKKGKYKAGIPVEYIKQWISEERLPEGWKPDHTQGLFDVAKRGGAIQSHIERLRAEEVKAKKAS